MPSPNLDTLINSTIPQYIRQEANNVLRNRLVLAMMEQRNRITYGNGGTEYDWKVRFKRNRMNPYAVDSTLTFARVNKFKTAKLPNDRAYTITEQIGTIDRLQNRGEEAIIKLFDDVLKTIANDMREDFGDVVYVDGNATGNETQFHGIESFLGTAATPIALGGGFVQPNDVYATLNTLPGTYGGAYTNGTWPNGSTDDTQYDFWSPILVDTASQVPGAYPGITDLTFKNTCNQALRKLITKTRKSKSVRGKLDVIMLEENMMTDFLNAQDDRTGLRIQAQESLAMLNLGFDVVNFDGVTIGTEYGMPFNTGYGWNFEEVEMKLMTDELFQQFDGQLVRSDVDTLSYKIALLTVGNFVFNPKFFGKLYNWGLALPS